MKPVTFVLSALLLFGCTGVPAANDEGGGSFEPVPIGGDGGGACAHPEEGCVCSQDVPIDCYLPATEIDGVITCQAGTRSCRDGLWSGCDSIREYDLVGTATALVTGPSACNPCDPSCAISVDTPSDADLPGSSSDLEYNPSAGGIQILGSGGSATPMLPDSDGDGVPDVADECPGPGAFLNADGSCYGDTFFFHELPYGGVAQIDPLDVNVTVRTADVYFLMDTTGSMGGEIANLQSGLTSGTYIAGCADGIIGAIRCTIPDAWFGVGIHDDYPYGGYGSVGTDVVYQNFLNVSSSIPAAQAAVNALTRHSGADGPESQTQALWAIATGGGLGPYLAPQTGCGAGEWGYPCFRDGSIPIVILFTDAPFHNGPLGYNYSFGATAVSGNDTFATAQATGNASTTWSSWTGDTCSHADDYTLTCATNTSRDVVFSFTVSSRGPVTITLEGSAYDTMVGVFDSRMNQIDCNDDAVGLMSRVTPTLTPGTYYVVVSGWASRCGNYRLGIGDASMAPPPIDYPVTWARTVTELNRRNIRVITVHSGDTYGRDDANALADATSSYSSSGSRYVFPIGDDGAGLSSAVVDAVVDLANYSRMDISARAVDNPVTAIDERGFVDAIAAVGWGPGSCSGISGGSSFVQCLPGTSVDFRIAFQNDIVMPTAIPQVFEFFIEVIGDGSFILERIPVRIVVPPEVPIYPASGEYWRDYDSTAYCADNERPDWGSLDWQIVDLPTGTSIRWELRASDTLAGLDTTTPVTFTTPSTTPSVDVAATLSAAGVPNLFPYLRVTAVLLANTALTRTPVLRSFEVRFTCVPVE